MGMIFHEFLIRPILTILVIIYQGLVLMHVPYPLGFSIIVLTILIRFITYPLITAQLRVSKKMQDLAPHLSRVKERHKNDATRIQQETMKLYKEHGVNPLAGCLPSLLQLPIIWALYSVLTQIISLAPNTIVAKVNADIYFLQFKLTSPWDQHFFGLPLGQNPSHLFAAMPLIMLVPVLTGVFQLIQSKMMFAKPQQTTEKKEDDFASAFQTQSTYIFPVMIAFFSYNFPLGLSLYWNTFTVFGILQQYQISGLGGLKDWIDVLWKLKSKK